MLLYAQRPLGRGSDYQFIELHRAIHYAANAGCGLFPVKKETPP